MLTWLLLIGVSVFLVFEIIGLVKTIKQVKSNKKEIELSKKKDNK